MGSSSRLPRAVIAMLADGRVHSGTEIARSLRVSRTAVWKHVRELKALGLEVEALPGHGYRLASPLELLDADRIRGIADCMALRELAVHTDIGSTNDVLLAHPAPLHGTMDVCLAETQTAGRGRRGRQWTAPFGAGLYLSMAWQFDPRPPEFTALSLAVGVAVHQALEEFAVTGVQLKWPNDLVADEGKLGGILVELRGEADGPAHVVIGVGINIALPPHVRERIAPHWGRGAVNLQQVSTEHISRNRLAGRVIARTAAMLERFQRQGFAPFRERFQAVDFLRDRPLCAPLPGGEIRGAGAGVDADGALRVVASDGRVARVVAGEVSPVLAQ